MNESKGIVYLCGPSGIAFVSRFNIARKLVYEAGYTPVSPDFLPAGLKENDYMRISLSILEAADTVVALKDWAKSQGAQIEWAYAQRTGKRRMTIAQFCEANGITIAPADLEGRNREKAG